MQQPQLETVTLSDILITEELSRRSRSVSVGAAWPEAIGESPRSPNLQAENQAMRTLTQQMVQTPEIMMQSLVEMAVELCQAGTAGVSLLETTSDGEEIFRWNVLAGTLKQSVGGTTPRYFSPCGVCLDRRTPQLFSYPERYFTYLQAAKTPVVEGLVLPLVADNYALGTIWIMSHNPQRHFDSEDVRVMASLAGFAAALLLKQRQTRELVAANVALETEILERKQVEAKLREAQTRLELSLRGANFGVWTYNVNTDEFWADDRAKQMHGHKPHEVHTFAEAGANIHPDDRDRAQAAFAQAVQNCSKLQIEYRVIWRDGSVHGIASYAEFIASDQGEGMFYGVAQDISDRLRLEGDRKRAEADRVQLLQEQANRLEAERMSQMKDEFLSMVSHELQSPLVAILGWTRLLRANPPTPALLTKTLDTIERNATVQAKLTQDLLDISRITVGKLRLSLQPIGLKSVIEMAIATVIQTAFAKGVNLVWWDPGQGSNPIADRDADSTIVMGDCDRLQQVICNLLTNAIKFTPEGGQVEVRLEQVDQGDRETGRWRGGKNVNQNSPHLPYALIQVKDTGIGISPEFLPHVFDRFHQAEKSGSAGGLGLGLAIAHHLVELHGGSTFVESPGIGRGTTFTIKLPLVSASL